MKLWLLKRPEDDCSWDEYDGFVIRAQNEVQARRIASENPGDEGASVWLSSVLSTCEELKNQGIPGIVLSDFMAG